MQVTGLTYIDPDGGEHAAQHFTLPMQVSNVVKLEHDNMFMSEEETATDIKGVTRDLQKIWSYTGYPPAPYAELINTALWKTTRRYNYYVLVLKKGYTAPVTFRPTNNEPNGQWYLIGYQLDERINDADKKYTFEFRLPPSLLGLVIYFDVYADCNLVYDPDAPVKIELPVLK